MERHQKGGKQEKRGKRKVNLLGRKRGMQRRKKNLPAVLWPPSPHPWPCCLFPFLGLQPPAIKDLWIQSFIVRFIWWWIWNKHPHSATIYIAITESSFYAITHIMIIIKLLCSSLTWCSVCDELGPGEPPGGGESAPSDILNFRTSSLKFGKK